MTDKANEAVEHFDIDSTEDELSALKAQADLLGVTYSTNIGLETLRKRVAAALSTDDADEDEGADGDVVVKAPEVAKPSIADYRAEAAKKVRVRVSCHDPMKKEYSGEIFTVMNSVVGVYKQFVQFNEPYHVPNIILDQIKEKQYQQFYTVTDERGRKIRKGKLVKAYSIEMLPPLTPEELEALANDQKARKAVT